MKKIKNVRYFFYGITIFLLFLCTGCKNEEVINCSFEFTNTELPQYLTARENNDFGIIYLTYTGEQKDVIYRTVRKDNNEVIDILEEIDITYTYKNPKTGTLEYGKTFMKEPGEYKLSIDACTYDEDKYNLPYTDVSLTIYLREKGWAEEVLLDTPAFIDVESNPGLDFTFTAPYSMCYSIITKNLSFKVHNPSNNSGIFEEDDGTYFIRKNQKVIIAASKNDEEADCTLLITCKPQVLSVGKAYRYLLESGEDRIYKFVDNRDHALNLSTYNDSINITIYTSEGEMRYEPNQDTYSYTANQEVYVYIYNASEETATGSLIVSDDLPISANQTKTYTIKGNESLVLRFDCFDNGPYEIFNNDSESFEITFCDFLGHSSYDLEGSPILKKELEKKDINFIRIQNKSSDTKEVQFTIEFSAVEARYGDSSFSSPTEYVKFIPTTEELYLIEGVSEIYDYKLNPVEFKDNLFYGTPVDKCYYLKLKSSKTISIGHKFETLKIGVRTQIEKNEYGIYYYMVNTNYNVYYSFETTAKSISYHSYGNNSFKKIGDITPEEWMTFPNGNQYIRVEGNETDNEILCSMHPNTLELNDTYAFSNNGDNLYTLISKGGDYTFTSIADRNGTVEIALKICKLIDGELSAVYETEYKSEVNETVHLENEDYYIIISLRDANDQAILFTVTKNS